ncbi:MAG: type II secretion system protein [Deltaproteobacteria bacterium]|nr:type II secretion system protein [Deltaproteobacteria bacterium]MBW2447731.1 type II secretion system protein [Deltaproteobacteria bacterium]
MSSTRPRRGFTLLEVLAAALIMAMFYGVLTAKGVESFAAEGDADRRLRASLVADRHLADIEAALAVGQPPAVGTLEDQEDEFAVRVDVSPLQLPWADSGESDDRGRSRRDAVPTLLAPPERGSPAILTVHVTVAWNDGLSERSVDRTTFAIDAEAIAQTLSDAGVVSLDEDGNPVFGANPENDR